MRDRQANRRIRLLLAIFALAFAGTLARAVWLQGVEAAGLSARAAKQHHELQTIPAGRGTIFDRTGVQLAIGEQTTALFADTRLVANARDVALTAHRILGVNANATYLHLLDRRQSFYLDRFTDPKLAAALLKHGFAGISGSPEEKRVYPQTTVAAPVIGFAGTDNRGLGGLEYQYDKQLAGRAGKETIIRDPFGRAIDVVKATPEREGSNVFTTIDRNIQATAEQVLRSTVSEWHARSATAVVLDPRTGEVLAMAQAPGYDANKTGRVPFALQRNRTVTDTYEPGSTFKLVTIAGALSERLATPQTKFYNLPYRIHVADRTVEDAEPRPTETLTVAQILARSSNVGAVTIAEKLGRATLMKWITRFGFGRPTGIDFPGESAGQMLPLDRWSDSTIGNVPIGQGIAVTPLQLASAYASIANEGVWIQPHLVTRVGGRVFRHFTHRRIVSPRIDAELKVMLTGVVDEHGGTGNAAAIPGYTVAGKTGTAQVPGKNGYSASNGYIASFVGMVPVAAPRFVVLVTVDQPRGSIYGGVVAAPAFAQIARFALQYEAVAPDDPRTLRP